MPGIEPGPPGWKPGILAIRPHGMRWEKRQNLWSRSFCCIDPSRRRMRTSLHQRGRKSQCCHLSSKPLLLEATWSVSLKVFTHCTSVTVDILFIWGIYDILADGLGLIATLSKHNKPFFLSGKKEREEWEAEAEAEAAGGRRREGRKQLLFSSLFPFCSVLFCSVSRSSSITEEERKERKEKKRKTLRKMLW